MTGNSGMATCSVGGCEDDGKLRRGWCNRHYRRWLKYGDPLMTRVRGTRNGTVDDRFWSKVNENGPVPAQGVAPGCCWIWTGCKNQGGYGQFGIGPGSRKVQAHRFAYERMGEQIPEGLQLDHLCRNRACVNPAHLEPVAQAENIRRGFSVSTANRLATHCPQRHPYDKANTYVRPSDGARYCRECARAHARATYNRKKEAA